MPEAGAGSRLGPEYRALFAAIMALEAGKVSMSSRMCILLLLLPQKHSAKRKRIAHLPLARVLLAPP